MTKNTTTVYLVRHGETDNNNLHRFIGSTDHPLNARGQAQAACLRAPMAKIHLDQIYASPLLRVMMTAAEVKGDREKEIIRVPGLREIECGEWEGKNREEIEAIWPGQIELWQHRPEELHMEGGETFKEVQDRAIEAFVQIVKQNRGKSIAVVSHMLTIQLIMAKLLSVPIHDVWEMVRLENTSVTTMQIEENGNFEVVKWADDSHLTDDLKNQFVKIAGFVTKSFAAKYSIEDVEGKHHFDLFAD